jgi:hypothetical protein
MQYPQQQQQQPHQSIEMNNLQNRHVSQITNDIKELQQHIINSGNNSKCLKFGLCLTILLNVCLIAICVAGGVYMKGTIDDTHYVTSHAKHWFELYEAAWKSSIPEDMRSFLRQDYASMFDYVGKFTKSANTQLEEEMGANEITTIINLVTSIAETAETMEMMDEYEPSNGHEVMGPIPELLHWGAEWLIEQTKIEHWVGLGSDCKTFVSNLRNVDWSGTYVSTECPDPCDEETEDCSCTSSNEQWDMNSEINEIADIVYDVCNSVSNME